MTQIAGTAQSAMAANAQGQSQKAYYSYLAAQNTTQIPKVLTAANLNTGEVANASAVTQSNLDRNVSTLEGAQKASMAANGVTGGSQTAEAVQRDTANKAALDRAAIRTNANLQTRSIAMGATNQVDALKQQSQLYTMAGDNAGVAGRMNATTSLLSGATQVASNYYKWKMTQPGGDSSNDWLGKV